MNKIFRREQNERGDIVITIMMFALFMFMFIVVVGFLAHSISNQSQTISTQIKAELNKDPSVLMSTACANLPTKTVEALTDKDGYKTGTRTIKIGGENINTVATYTKNTFLLTDASTGAVLCKVNANTPTQEFDNGKN